MKIPDKLPVVRSSSPLAQGFRLAFDALNEVRDCLIALRPMSGHNIDVYQTPAGTIYNGRAGGSTTTEETDGPRWA